MRSKIGRQEHLGQKDKGGEGVQEKRILNKIIGGCEKEKEER